MPALFLCRLFLARRLGLVRFFGIRLLSFGLGIMRHAVGQKRQRRARRRVLGVLLGRLVPHVRAGVRARQLPHARERAGIVQMPERLDRLVLQIGAGVVQHYLLEHVRRAVGCAHLTQCRHRLAPHVGRGVVIREVQQLGEVSITASTTDAVINASKTGTSTTISDSALRRLPTLNRNFSDFVQLVPQSVPAHILRIRKRVRTERDFEYYL